MLPSLRFLGGDPGVEVGVGVCVAVAVAVDVGVAVNVGVGVGVVGQPDTAARLNSRSAEACPARSARTRYT